MTTDRKIINFKLGAILLALLAFGLRVQGLSVQPLWGDEGYSFYAATLPLGEMLAATAVDIHPPLYYALLRGWLAIAGPGAESARFLSVLSGTLLVPLMALFVRQVAPPPGRNRTGLLAAAITAFAPLAIYYSQEVRMYSLVTLLGLGSTYFLARVLAGDKKAVGPYLAVSAAALYTMYYAAFILIFQAVYLLTGGKKRLARLSLPIGAGILYLPWIFYALPKLLVYISHKRAADADLPLGAGAFLLAHLKAFSLGHLSGAWAALGDFTGVFVLVALAGIWLVGRDANRRRALWWPGLYLAVPLLLGWGVNRLYPFNPPNFERTLLAAAPAWWLLVGIGLSELWRRRRVWGVLATGLLLAGCAAGLVNFYITPRYAESDYRPLLAEVAARATPNDVLLAGFEWQAGYYQAYLPQKSRPQIVNVPGWGVGWGSDPAAMQADLATLLQDHVLWFPAHQTLGHLWEDRAEQAIARLGFPALAKWYNPQTKLVLAAPQAELQPGPLVNFNNQMQAQVSLPRQTDFESGRGIIPVEINWLSLGENRQKYLLTLKLADFGGQVWAARDVPLADEPLSAGQTVAARHGLFISAGTPPGSYTLKLSLTAAGAGSPLDVLDQTGRPQGVEAILLPVTVTPAVWPVGEAALPRQVRAAADFDHRLRLVGYSVATSTVKTGDLLAVNLFWQGISAGQPDLLTFVQVQNAAGQAVALTERSPVYPVSAWQAGTLLDDRHAVRLPASLEAGTYRLAAGVLLPDKTRLTTASADQVALGSVTVLARPHTYQPPEPAHSLAANFSGGATLVGYDLLPQTVEAGQEFNLTLYWRAETGFNREWAVFAHVLSADGQIWGQRDQIPGGGAFPTVAWSPGEFITDERRISLKPDTPPGAYFVEVGLYDPNTFERVAIAGQGDSLRLDAPVTVIDKNP